MEFVFQQAERRLLITFFGNIKVEEISGFIEAHFLIRRIQKKEKL